MLRYEKHGLYLLLLLSLSGSCSAKVNWKDSVLLFPSLINVTLWECNIFFARSLVWCTVLVGQTPLDFIVNILSVCSLHCFWNWLKITPTSFRLWFILGCCIWFPDPSPSSFWVSRILSVDFCSTWIRSTVCNSSSCFPFPPWNALGENHNIIWRITILGQISSSYKTEKIFFSSQ